MTQQAENGIVDVFKERLANPFIFTFFWVSCTWNWKVIYWFLYEPLKPSIKFERIPYEWTFWVPLILTFVVTLVTPWLNNLVEIIKQFAAHKLNVWIHDLNWKKMVTESEYQAKVDEVATLKQEKHDLINANVLAQENENKAKEEMILTQKEVSSHLENISKLERDKSKSSSEINNLLEKNRQLILDLSNQKIIIEEALSLVNRASLHIDKKQDISAKATLSSVAQQLKRISSNGSNEKNDDKYALAK